ncbi:MAG TPA: helix-turn-helix transcriptional regulator [Acidobacteriaceae bacterium]
MKLCDKIRYLREVEGNLRGFGRAMTQGELVRAIREEMDAPLSQSYLSQIESGARPHLTNTTRLLLAKFFKVHPGYLVDDPDGYNVELLSDLRGMEDKLDLWLIGGAERFRRDPELRRALLAVARHEDSRSCLLLLESVLETPSLAERLMELLRPSSAAAKPAPKPEIVPRMQSAQAAASKASKPRKSTMKKEVKEGAQR